MDTLTVRRATFTMTVEFDAYVQVEADGTVNLPRVQSEVADAIEYRAPHLSDTEEGDAIVALVGGGSGGAVMVKLDSVNYAHALPAQDEVDGAIEGTEAWL